MKPRILIAGTHSGAGKTTIATGIMAALRRRGLTVQGFKVGPDFIDPTFHHVATGRRARNLDGWMLPRETNLALFARASSDADATVIEGVMGMFDGKSGASLAGTTAEMALWLDAAAVLVLDASAMAGSAAAIVHGFDTLLPELRLAGVISNRVAGQGHYEYLRDSIAARCRPQSLGYLTEDAALSIPERHLGLHLAGEVFPPERLDQLAVAIESHIDLDRLLEISARPDIPFASTAPTPRRATRIGIARDRAFCFYYEDNLDLLRNSGAETVEFSPIADSALPPDLDAIYLGGGYPELYAEALSANTAMRAGIAGFIARDRPVYAECGGFMYLTGAIVDAKGIEWPMVGAFPTKARMRDRMAHLGYIEVSPARGELARGHQFRYSEIDPMPASIQRLYAETFQVRSTLGSYLHLHFLSCPAFAGRIFTPNS